MWASFTLMIPVLAGFIVAGDYDRAALAPILSVAGLPQWLILSRIGWYWFYRRDYCGLLVRLLCPLIANLNLPQKCYA